MPRTRHIVRKNPRTGKMGSHRMQERKKTTMPYSQGN